MKQNKYIITYVNGRIIEQIAATARQAIIIAESQAIGDAKPHQVAQVEDEEGNKWTVEVEITLTHKK